MLETCLREKTVGDQSGGVALTLTPMESLETLGSSAYSITSASAAQNRHRQHIVAEATKRAMSTRERTTYFIRLKSKLNILVHRPKNVKIQYNISGSTIRSISPRQNSTAHNHNPRPYLPSSPNHPRHSDSFPLLQRQSLLPTSPQRRTTCPPSLARIPPLPWTRTPPFHPPARTPGVTNLPCLPASQTRRPEPVHERRGGAFRQEGRLGDEGSGSRCKVVGERRGRRRGRSVALGPIERDSIDSIYFQTGASGVGIMRAWMR